MKESIVVIIFCFACFTLIGSMVWHKKPTDTIWINTPKILITDGTGASYQLGFRSDGVVMWRKAP
jgi:hypothetical protein